MQPLARMVGISKSFGRVAVLENVGFDVLPGEVHALAGENGAGKSTLIKILAGVHTDFGGRIEIGGRAVRPKSPLDAGRLGVAVIHQELSLVPSMSVADNLTLGRWPTRAGLILGRRQRAAAREILAELGLNVDVDQLVGELPIATQQLLEIAKALTQAARVIVMDEPTSALSTPEVERLFVRIADLKARGCGIVYITHKLEEIHRIADRITVLRDGRRIATAPAAEVSAGQLVSWMVGREITEQVPRVPAAPGEVRLRVRDFSIRQRGVSDFSVTQRGRTVVQPISFSVRAGEILGLAGLQGSGNSALLMGLFGACGKAASGETWLDERRVALRSPREAISAGVALLTNDRKATGLVLPLSILANLTLADLPRLCRAGWRRPGRERAAAASLAQRLHLRAAALCQEVNTLSGGNQQKVLLAKWLQTEPRVLLLDEPTRGIDVGAKREIYELINDWTAQGVAIILITSELPELLGLADRILVLHRGRLTAEFARGDFAPDAIMAAAMGQTEERVSA
jgi:ribose transport system ATP-binding protein